ncbi:MAG: sodium:calcium antiporter, partial [Myxococcota bacterium]
PPPALPPPDVQLVDPSAVAFAGVSDPVALTGLGLALLIGGAELTVEAAVHLAHAIGVSEELIGLTLIAVGTSLPELVASVAATVRGQTELAIGNVVGSNIFNLLLVLGITSIVRPVPVPPGGHTDLLVMTSLSLVLFGVSVSYRQEIVRTEACVLLAVYLGYLGWRSGIAFAF